MMVWNEFKSRFLPVMEADGGSGAGSAGAQNGDLGLGGEIPNVSAKQVTMQGGQIDYEKIASIVSGKQQVAEDTVLKNYFKQQGLSQEEVSQAIVSFKTEKAKNQPDVNVLQQQLTQAAAAAQQAMLDKEATLAALGLGIDQKTIPYVLKLADFSNVIDQSGKMNEDALKNAVNKVLEDVPQLKPSTQSQSGFVQLGAGGAGSQLATDQDTLKAAFGL